MTEQQGLLLQINVFWNKRPASGGILYTKIINSYFFTKTSAKAPDQTFKPDCRQAGVQTDQTK
jgi:hypothetical protein